MHVDDMQSMLIIIYAYVMSTNLYSTVSVNTVTIAYLALYMLKAHKYCRGSGKELCVSSLSMILVIKSIVYEIEMCLQSCNLQKHKKIS